MFRNKNKTSIVQQKSRVQREKEFNRNQCQKCHQFGHYIFECTNNKIYQQRLSRSIVLKNQIEQKFHLDLPPGEKSSYVLPKTSLDSQLKELKRISNQESNSDDSDSDSDGSSSSSSSINSIGSSSSSSSGSSSSSDSSDSRSSDSSSSSSRSSSSDNDSDDSNSTHTYSSDSENSESNASIESRAKSISSSDQSTKRKNNKRRHEILSKNKRQRTD